MVHLKFIVFVIDLNVQVALIVLINFLLNLNDEGDQAMPKSNIKWEMASPISIDNGPFHMTVFIIVLLFSWIHSEESWELEPI